MRVAGFALPLRGVDDEQARQIGAFDWGATPLGPRASWPRSLATAVDVILVSPWPMAVVWGADLVPLYNDPFARLLAGAHPAALGRPVGNDAPATAVIDAMACERALAGQVTEAPAPDGRLTLRYAPLRRDDDAVGGVLVSAIDAASSRQSEATFALEQRLGLAMEASSAGAWSWDARTNESTWDDRYHAMYGFAAGEPRTHEAWLARIHPEDRPRVVARLDAMLRTPGDDTWNMELRAVCPGLGGRWMQGLGRARRDVEGQVVSITGINLDVTARKQAEEKLRESEEKLRLCVESAPAEIAMFDRDMRYLAVSRRWLGYFGLPDDILGRCHYDVFPDLPQRWRETHERCLAGAVERAEEDRFERADGLVQWLRWQVLPWRTAAGEVGAEVTATRMRVAGPEVRLRKRDVQTLAMALHELATNARKHGALAACDGRLAVTWRVERDAPGRTAPVLEWIESGLDPRSGRDDRPTDGYGRALIERALPYALSAETSFEVGEDGLRCAIRLPLDDVEAPAAAE